MKDTNPDHYKVGDVDFVKFMDDPQIKGFGDWMFANGFNTGELSVNRWISVKDRLPDKTDRYMCLCYDFVTKSYWHELLWHENNRWWKNLATHEHDYTKHVVYWMLLPEPPKGGTDGD